MRLGNVLFIFRFIYFFVAAEHTKSSGCSPGAGDHGNERITPGDSVAAEENLDSQSKCD